MTLTFLGKELNASEEHELISSNKYGFSVRVTYRLCYAGFKTQTFNNIDEVHSLYAPLHRDIAFESTIHSNGCTRPVKDIDSVVVVKSTRQYKSFHGRSTDSTQEEYEAYYSE